MAVEELLTCPMDGRPCLNPNCDGPVRLKSTPPNSSGLYEAVEICGSDVIDRGMYFQRKFGHKTVHLSYETFRTIINELDREDNGR